MLAKLFDDISIASLFRSLGLAILLLGLVFYVNDPQSAELHILNNTWDLPAYLVLVLAIPLLSFAVLWFNSKLIAIPLFKSDYQPAIMTALLIIPVLVTQASINLILLLPLVAIFLTKLFSLAETPDISYLLFDCGSLIGLMLFLEPLTLSFLFLVWLALINYGRFSLKETLMPVVGFFAVWFLASSIIYWSLGMKELKLIYQGLLDFSFGMVPSWRDNIWRVIPVALIFIPAIIQLLNVYAKAKVLQRQSLGLLMLFFVVTLIIGALFYDPAGIWIWMGFPMAALLVNLVHGLKRSWMKDLVYIFLLSYLALFIL